MASIRRLRLLALTAALSAAGPLLNSACSEPVAGSLTPIPAASLEELLVNGQVVPEIELKRHLVYTLGARDLKSKILDMQTEEEMNRQLDAGVDPQRFEVVAAELEDAKQKLIEQIKEQYPNEKVEDVLILNGMQIQNLERQFRQTKLFDAVFLPEDPEEWSDTTLAILETTGGGTDMVAKLREAYVTRQESGQEVDPNDPGLMLWKNIMRQLVMQGLGKNTVVMTGADGLPPEIAMKVNGQEVTTEELYARIADRVTEDDKRQARLWAAKTHAMAQDLTASEKLLEEEAFRQRYAEHEEPYAGSPIPLELVAVNLQKFPSMEVYKQYFRLRESYRDLIADELNDDTLGAHLDRANQMMGLALVDAEVIFISAYDPKTAQPVEDGWDRARTRAIEAATKLAEGAAWDAILEEYSDFWDPPAPPPNPQMPQQPPPSKNKGRFGPLNRNDFLQRMGESDYSMFLTGYSVADHVFFDQEPGTTGGPFTGRLGYYITRVKTRGRPGSAPFSLANENQRELILQDYLTVRFNEYAEQALEEAEVIGLY